MKRVLIIDSDQVMLQALTGLMKIQGGFLVVHGVQNVSHAKSYLQNHFIDIVITVIRPTTLEFLEFIGQDSGENGAGKIIAITYGLHQNILDMIKQNPSVIHLDHSDDILLLTKRVYTELQIDYGGKIRGVNLSSFLQMMELESTSCTLQVTVKDKVGFLWLKTGEIVAAKTSRLTGEKAALEVISWSNVMIDIDYTDNDVERDIFTPMMTLLLESGQLSDERKSKIDNLRSCERHDLLLTSEYVIGNMTRQCILHDISLGGAYVETNQKIPKGQDFQLVLASKKLQTSCTVDVTTARLDKNGVGVRFTALNSFQEQLVQALIDSCNTTPNEQMEDSVPSPAALF